MRSPGGQGDHHQDSDRDTDEEEEEEDGGHGGRAHRRISPVSRGVMSRKPRPYRRRAPRAAASGGCRVSVPSRSSRLEAIEIVTRNPRMTPAANTRPIPIATATMMRSTPASAPLLTALGAVRSRCFDPRETPRASLEGQRAAP